MQELFLSGAPSDDASTHRYRIRTAIPALVAVCIMLISAAEVVQAKRPAVSESAPDFALKSTDGRNLRLSEFRGGVVIVHFWSSNCSRCRDQLKQLDSIGAATGSDHLKILSVNVDSDSDAARRVVTDHSVRVPVLLDTEKTVSRLYDPSKLPTAILIDPHGTVRYIHKGYRRGDELEYVHEINELLAE